MTDEPRSELGTYLKDHYAAGVGAMELIEHWCKVRDGDSLGGFFQALLADVQADHKTLHQIMSAMEIEESSLRNASAWVGEKLGRGKLGFGGGDATGLPLLQTLEALHLGITGKSLLWRALAASRAAHPVLQQTDFDQLEKRALEQLDRVEHKRVETARSTFQGA